MSKIHPSVAIARGQDEAEKIALPRLGFAGTGWIGQLRMKAILESGKGSVAAIYDPDRGIVNSAQTLAPECAVTSSFEELLKRELDGLVIATPSALHMEQTIAGLEQGLAVFCQKPLGRNFEETERAIRTACENKRLLGVDLSYRHIRGVQKIRDLLKTRALGEIYFIDLVFHNAYGPGKDWFYDAQQSGGGCLLDLGIHLIDLGLWAMDFPEIEKTSTKMFRKGLPYKRSLHEVEDFVTAIVDLKTGARMQISCSWNAHAGRDAVIEATFFGARGGAKLRNIHGSFYNFVAEKFNGTQSEMLAAPPDDWGGRAAVSWIDQLCKRGNQFDSEIRQLNQVAMAIDRIYQS